MRGIFWSAISIIFIEFFVAPIGGRVFNEMVPADAEIRTMIPDFAFYHWGYASVFALGALVGIWLYRWRVLGGSYFPWPSKLKTITNQSFENVTVRLDGKDFHHCNFKNVTLRWEGNDFNIVYCNFDKPTTRIEIRGRKLTLLTDMYKELGFLSEKFAQDWTHMSDDDFKARD